VIVYVFSEPTLLSKAMCKSINLPSHMVFAFDARFLYSWIYDNCPQ